MTIRISSILRGIFITPLTLLFASGSLYAQGNKPTMVVGEAMLSVNAGTPRAQVDAIAAGANAVVVRSFGSLDFAQRTETYQLRMTIAKPDVNQTQAAIDKLKTDPLVTYAGPNRISYPTQATQTTAIPNDPRFNEQWDKVYMNLPQAWTLEKGKSNVVVAVMDTGTDIDHPEFVGLGSRLLPGINSFRNTNDPRDILPTTNVYHGHGTHTAGIIAAATNNGVGVAGCAWENVKLMPINAVDDNAGFTQAATIAALQFIQNHQKANPNNKYVVNLSWGGTAPSDTPDLADPFDALMLTMAKSDVVFMISAGNSGDSGTPLNPPSYPANMASAHVNIFCVAASNHLGQRSHYSQFRPYTTIAAPGGDDIAGKLILSTFPTNAGSYAFEMGTSMAAPNASGVAALLLSVPGVKGTDIKPLLTSTARQLPGVTSPSPELGYGIIDAYASLMKVAIGVTILEPLGTGGKASGNTTIPDPIETLRPPIKIQVSQITPNNLKISIDGGSPIAQLPDGTTPTPGVPYFVVTNVTVTTTDPNDSTATLPATYTAVVGNVELAPGQHKIDVSGTKPGVTSSSDTVVTDTRSITITPHVIPAGRAMVSIPYYAYLNTAGAVVTDPHDPGALNQITPQNYLGTNFRLARWLPDQGRYVYYTSFGQSDNAASFTPSDVITRQDADPARPEYAKWPLGLGFFSDTESAKPILTKGQPVTDKAFIIPLKGNGTGDSRFISWNMIGDPFPFDLPFNSLLIDTPTGRITLQEASDRGYILPNIYTYDGANGYTFRTLPDGALFAWNAHWIGVTSKVDLNLVLPPAKLTRAASLPGTSATSTVWKVQLSARVKNMNDTFNFIGVGNKAQDGYDRNDVAKPPMVGPYVSVGISHTDWAEKSGLYAQDIRSGSGTKSWSISVDTDQPNSDVTVNWNAATLPRNVRLTLKDESNGSTYDMRNRTAITFNSGSNTTSRKFTITANQSVRGSIRIANLNVRTGNRATGSSVIGFNLTADATYEVKVLNGTGAAIGTVGSRAAAASGDVSLVWNGRDSSGKSVAAGTYLIQVRATTADGDSVKAVMPFTVVR